MGEPVGLLEQATVTMSIPEIATDIFQLPLPAIAPAYYRLAVNVRGPGIDQELKSYLAVPEQRLDASIIPARASARAGDQLPFTLANHGPTSILYGVDYRLQRVTPDGWRNCNVEQAWVMIGLSLDPGGRADLTAVLPAKAPAGRYRVSKDVSGGGTRINRTLAFEFDVSREPDTSTAHER